MSGVSKEAKNLGAFPPMSTAGRTNGLWPGAYAPIPTDKFHHRSSSPTGSEIRDCVSVRRKRVLSLSVFYDAPEEPDQLVNPCYGLEPETIA